jgi:DNA-binding LacI/PurR family transcriptional regulator/serine phosphatase RsbU (regulator of sigma subunit)
MNHRRPRIALLFDSLISEYAVQLSRAVERAATLRDVSVVVVMGQPIGDPVAAAATQNQIYELVGQHCVDGVIIVSSTVGHYCGIEGLVALCRSYAPLPVCSVGVELPGIPSLVIDNEAGMALGVQHLIDVHHCRRVAFIGGPKASVESNHRLAGYRRAVAERGMPADEQLVVFGSFTVESGVAAMRELLERNVTLDAVVAANDYMALGALDVLEAAGRKVPTDLMVCGFDDINSAHFTRPSLSTLRQPMWWLGEQAIDCVLQQRQGESVPLLRAGPVDFVRRESCGCGYQVGITTAPEVDSRSHLSDIIRERRAELAELMRAAISIPNDALGNWPSQLLNALDQEISGVEGRFTAAFEEILERAQREGASLDEFQRVVSVLRSEFRRVRIQDNDECRQLERLWHNARVLVGAASIRFLGRRGLEQQHATTTLNWMGERLATTLSLSLLREELMEHLPSLEIKRGAVALYTGHRSGMLKALAARDEKGELPVSSEPFPETEFAPASVFDTETCEHFVALPITFETEMLGVAVLSSGAQPSVYEGLRQQIGSAVKGAMLHREMVSAVARREHLEAERLAEETRLASDIQTNMQPASTDVRGLEIAGLMVPAAEAGGDYYDVIPAQDGAWIGIGDVAGHGLGAGLVMLMLQSMVAVLGRIDPEPLPSQAVIAMGEAIWDNVRLRLKRDDHATLTVFRYHTNGHFTFAGAHEDIIVWRKRTGRCETISTPGFWVGAIPSIRRMTKDSELVLEKDDVMVLYTDGVTETRNARHEQFTLERLIRYVEDSATKPTSTIRDSINEAVRAWGAGIDDDITLLVIRYVGE